MAEDLVYRSFELAAERAGDISPSVYEKYFARCPASEGLMSHIDELVRGKMMDEVYKLLMTEDYAEEENYLNWEVKNHQFAYSVEPQMYDTLFNALVETIRESLGDDWNADFEDAWRERTEALLQEIHQRFAKQAAS